MSFAPDQTAEDLALLRSLITQATAAGELGTIANVTLRLAAFASRTWSDEEHRVVYQSLCAALRGIAAPIPLGQQMAAEATRLGHPDVDWSLYF
jgi:hypothetical protein